MAEITKEFLKSMPIWDRVEAFGVEIEKFRHEIDNDLTRYKEAEKRLGCHEPPGNSGPSNGMSIGAQTKENNDPGYDESLHLLRKRVKNIQEVYAMIDSDKPWVRCRIAYIFRRPRHYQKHNLITTFRVKLSPNYTQIRDVNSNAVAWMQHHGLGLRLTKRVIAGSDDSNLLPGMIGNVPDERSKYRYLVHFDNGSAGYFHPERVFPIVSQSSKPWKDPIFLQTDEGSKHIPNVYKFLRDYPKRYYVKVEVGSTVCLDRDGVAQSTTVLEVQEHILKLRYKDGTEECVYRGSTRLIRHHKSIADQLKNTNDIDHFHPTVIVYMNDYYTAGQLALGRDDEGAIPSKRSLNTARKSTATRNDPLPKKDVLLDDAVVPDIKEAQTITSLQFKQSNLHKCTPQCSIIEGMRTESSVIDIVAEFRNASDLRVPLMLGWKRILSRVPNDKGSKPKNALVHAIVYETPCGKLLQKIHYIRKYLSDVNSKLDIDYFSLGTDVHLNTGTSSFKAVFYDPNIAVDKDNRCLENKFISLVNQYDRERLPKDYEYCNETLPHPTLEARGFSFNKEFKSGCDCDGDCYQRASCPCHILNEEFSGRESHLRGNISKECQYYHKRLSKQVSTGIFECNSMCKCSSKCNNRVVQNGIRFRLQIQKFSNQKGWGVITLDDIPAGAFICTYTAELLDDADQYGDSDMYYADLDYISINEQNKLPDSDSDEGIDQDTRSKRKSPSEEDEESDDGYMPKLDDERRYPARNASRGYKRNQNRQVQFKKIHNILKSHDYTLDARMRGNLGRFLNHSCDPNCIAQNVFIETHDLRFPNVAFFASKTIKALDEVTWDYNYKMGTIEGRKIICLCRKSNCRGRIL